MITQLILNVLLSAVTYFVHGLFFVLPDIDFLSTYQTNITSAFCWFLGLVDFMNPIIPFPVVLSVFSFFVAFYTLLFSFKFISWILRKIPTLGLS